MNENKNSETVEQNTITEADVQARVLDAVERARADWARAEAEQKRMAAMSQEERAGYELRQREAELDEREKDITRRELKAMAVEMLAQRGLPRELAEALPYDSEAACLNGLNKLERAFRDAVQKTVDLRLRGEAPLTGQKRGIDPDGMSDAEYYKLNTKF